MRISLSVTTHSRPSSERSDTTQDPQHVGSSLRAEAQDDETGPLAGVVLPDVREADIEGQQNAPLGAADTSQAGVLGTPQVLIPDAQCVVALLRQEGPRIWMQVLVDLETHQAGRATTSSRASSPAYIRAALTSSTWMR